MARKKEFLCVYECDMGNTALKFHHTAKGISKSEVEKEHEVEHDECGLDLNNSPIGGAEGQYNTCLVDVIPITPAKKKFLREIGIY